MALPSFFSSTSKAVEVTEDKVEQEEALQASAAEDVTTEVEAEEMAEDTVPEPVVQAEAIPPLAADPEPSAEPTAEPTSEPQTSNSAEQDAAGAAYAAWYLQQQQIAYIQRQREMMQYRAAMMRR